MRSDLSYCDFLVLAPIDFEIEAVEEELKKGGWKTSLLNNDDFPRIIEATIPDPALASSQRYATIVQLNKQGVLNASADTAKILELYDPGYVISFGIAGSFREEDAPIGSVIYADPLFYYEPSKDKSQQVESRMDPIPVSSDLRNLFRNIPSPNIRKNFGPWASGEKLIADALSDDKRRILGTHSSILGVEMEAAGVGRAVNILSSQSAFIVIKGISDLADANKNTISEEQQNENRKLAAFNAAYCLVELMHIAPLRRLYRSIPKPGKEKLHQIAIDEAAQIADAMKPYGIKVSESQLYNCLYDRRGTIPAYFHWLQETPALHWIDFKILTAMKALPNDIVTPVPLVTVNEKLKGGSNQTWSETVYNLLGVYPVTQEELSRHLQELSVFNETILPRITRQKIKKELEEMQQSWRSEIFLNVMQYVIGQFCHRRMFVFVWESSRDKWKYLSQVFGIWFATFEWETYFLGSKLGKQYPPGSDLVIEPTSYPSLKYWLETSPDPNIIQEFVDHFRCHTDSIFQINPSQKPIDQLEELMQCWSENFFKRE